MDRSVHEAMTPVTDRRSSASSPLSFSEDSLDIWAGLDLDHLHRFTGASVALQGKRGPPSKKRGTLTSVADPVPAARALVFEDHAQRLPKILFFI
jgi:hypothetical protein